MVMSWRRLSCLARAKQGQDHRSASARIGACGRGRRPRGPPWRALPRQGKAEVPQGVPAQGPEEPATSLATSSHSTSSSGEALLPSSAWSRDSRMKPSSMPSGEEAGVQICEVGNEAVVMGYRGEEPTGEESGAEGGREELDRWEAEVGSWTRAPKVRGGMA